MEARPPGQRAASPQCHRSAAPPSPQWAHRPLLFPLPVCDQAPCMTPCLQALVFFAVCLVGDPGFPWVHCHLDVGPRRGHVGITASLLPPFPQLFRLGSKDKPRRASPQRLGARPWKQVLLSRAHGGTGMSFSAGPPRAATRSLMLGLAQSPGQPGIRQRDPTPHFLHLSPWAGKPPHLSPRCFLCDTEGHVLISQTWHSCQPLGGGRGQRGLVFPGRAGVRRGPLSHLQNVLRTESQQVTVPC